MTVEEQKLRKELSEHRRRIRFWLKPLPRKANLHRYPFLSYFAKSARKRSYLWSFRVDNAIPALYAGCIITLLPLYGVQLPLAFVAALILRANLPIIASLQIVSNPITVLPIWFAAYQIGRNFLSVIGVDVVQLNREEVRLLLYNFTHGSWGRNLESLAAAFGVTALGGIIMGTFFGIITSVIYRIVANRTVASYRLLHSKLNALKTKNAEKNKTPKAPSK